MLSRSSVDERRQTDRDATTDAWMTCFIQRPGGEEIEGVVKNVSEGGAQIIASSPELRPGDEVRIMMVLLGDQKVECRCEVRHVNWKGDVFGVRFVARPEPFDEPMKKRCGQCRGRYPAASNFCPICGEKLRPL